MNEVNGKTSVDLVTPLNIPQSDPFIMVKEEWYSTILSPIDMINNENVEVLASCEREAFACLGTSH